MRRRDWASRRDLETRVVEGFLEAVVSERSLWANFNLSTFDCRCDWARDSETRRREPSRGRSSW